MSPTLTKIEEENKVHHNGVYVRFHYMKPNGGFIKIRKSIKKPEICPICMKELVESDGLYLVISNQAGVPNRVLHKTCVTTQQETMDKLGVLYEEAQIMHKQFGHWF
jgi:hypothetical protein